MYGQVAVVDMAEYALFDGLFAHGVQVSPSPYCPTGQPQETLDDQELSYPVMYCAVPG